MSERHMTEGEYALRLAASIADAEDNNRMVWSSTAGTVALARALLSTSSAVRGMREALIDATAHLAGAASAYRKYARRHRAVGQSEIDPFFATRADDFDKAVERSRAALSLVEGEDKPGE